LKILVVAVALMFAAMLVAPVMAKKPEKIKLSVFASLAPYSEPNYWISGNIIHGRGATCNGMALISWEFPPFPLLTQVNIC
jgi:hypothetical protein